METFWSLFRESIIVQALLTLALWSAIIYLSVTNQAIPELLSTGGIAILGFWFGSKTASVALARKVE